MRRAQATVKTPVDQEAVNQPAQAERDGDQAHRDQHDAARNVLGINQVERTGEQQAGDEAGLHAQLLLMEQAGEARGGIQMQPPADHDEREDEFASKGKQYADRTAMKDAAAP